MFSLNVNAASKWGKGELQLDDYVVEKFIEYLRIKPPGTPWQFAVSLDGRGYNYYYCPTGADCGGGGLSGQILEECSRYSNGVECLLFASRRTIRWKNGINPAKGKASRLSGKWSDNEIKAKLTELGFYNNDFLDTTTTPKITKKKETKKVEKKITKKITKSDADIVSKLKDLKDLLDTGVLSEEDFKKAKKKLLN